MPYCASALARLFWVWAQSWGSCSRVLTSRELRYAATAWAKSSVACAPPVRRLKLFERVYSPLAAGLLQPYRPDSKLQDHKRTQLDRLYQKLQTISMSFSMLLASKLPEQREQKPRQN